jgi:hypothetical protein
MRCSWMFSFSVDEHQWRDVHSPVPLYTVHQARSSRETIDRMKGTSLDGPDSDFSDRGRKYGRSCQDQLGVHSQTTT